MKVKRISWYTVLIIGVISFGIAVRFFALGTIPLGVHYDESYNGIDALRALEQGDLRVFYQENTGREGFHINVIAFFISLFGNNNWGLRSANALWGSLTIIGFYFLLRQLSFSRLSVALGTFVMATSFWHIVFSRTAYRAIMVPLILVWTFYFFWKGLEEKDRRWRVIYFALSGAFLGLGFHTYIAFRVAPLIMLVLFAALLLTQKKFLKLYWRYVVIFILLSFLTALPVLLYFVDHAQDLVYRSNSVSVFNAPHLTFPQALWKSLSAHINAFFFKGDTNFRHNYNGQPLLPATWSVLFAIGFLISVKEIGATLFKKNIDGVRLSPTKWFYVSVLAQSIFWIMLLPGVLSIEGIPHSLRIIGVIPGAFLFLLLPLEYIIEVYHCRLGKANKPKVRLLLIGLVLMTALSGIQQVYTHFALWARDARTEGAYERKLYNFGLLIKELPLHKNNYIITAPTTNITADRKQSSLKVSEFVGYPNSKAYLFYRPQDGLVDVGCDDPLIVLLESDQTLRDQLRAKCPGISSQKYGYDNDKYVYWVLRYN